MMRRIAFTSLAYLVAIIFQLTFSTNAKAQKSPEDLKIISYNIWNGFDWGKDLERKGEMVQWVRSQNPDILALQELCGYTHEQLLSDAKKWGHNYAEILKTSGYPVGITSKYPIEVKERILENMHHGALHCKVADIDFMVIHFSPSDYKRRQVESKIIREKLSDLDENQKKYIVLGDFNALSPFDGDTYKTKASLLDARRKSDAANENNSNLIDGEFEYGVIGSLLGYPLIDISQRFTSEWDDRISFPTQVFEKQKGEGRSEKSVRIDYILVSPYLATKCEKAKVLNGEATYYLSDHYPVMAEFKMD
ncbi:endonuclease/exonuclease/phosphatase family protein [Echinicola salinicaeni]|uniref:endonuclease/exonuclease/phosphatase family protein n=1 Tax=Echinicola salinicaeni TaxID=2762757 RepID=UPI0016447E17|nr:endonuclease/exonuclease/phosphatase family protein [Echinicola salinicaeni]